MVILVILLFLDFRYGIGRASFTLKTFELLSVLVLGFFSYPVFKLGLKKLDKFEDEIFYDIDSGRLGFEGENTVAGWLQQILPKDKYTILQNFALPKHLFDIDFIIIGPKGIIVLETKNLTDHYQFSNDEFLKIKNNQKILLSPKYDPRDQLRRHVYHLIKFFEVNRYSDLRILKALVFIDANRISINGNTGIYIASGFDSLKKFLDSATLDVLYTPEFCEKLKQVLSK